MSEYFPKLESLGTNVNVELDLSNYTTKTDLKNTTAIDTSDIGKLEFTPVDLSKLSNVVKNNVAKKTDYNELLKKNDY